jgi:hypothetical protein
METCTSALSPVGDKGVQHGSSPLEGAANEEETVHVETLSGTTVSVALPPSATVGDLKAAVLPKLLEASGPVKLKLLAGDAVLAFSDDVKLSEAGVNGHSVLTAVAEQLQTFNIKVKDYQGPNSPRFGCTTRVKYELRCTCGHSEVFYESQGYVMALPGRQVYACPECKGEPCEELKAKNYPGPNVINNML